MLSHRNYPKIKPGDHFPVFIHVYEILFFYLIIHFEIWYAFRHHCCLVARQISERSNESKPTSRGFKIWDLVMRRQVLQWIETQDITTNMLIEHDRFGSPQINISEFIDPVYPTGPLYSLNGKTPYRQISQSLEAARLDVIMIISLWNLTGIWTARGACQISERLVKSKRKSRNLETSRDLMVRRFIAYVSVTIRGTTDPIIML